MIQAGEPMSVIMECVNALNKGVTANSYNHLFTLVKIGLSIPMYVVFVPLTLIETVIRIVTLPLIAVSLPFTREPTVKFWQQLRFSVISILFSLIILAESMVGFVVTICRG